MMSLACRLLTWMYGSQVHAIACKQRANLMWFVGDMLVDPGLVTYVIIKWQHELSQVKEGTQRRPNFDAVIRTDKQRTSGWTELRQLVTGQPDTDS